MSRNLFSESQEFEMRYKCNKTVTHNRTLHLFKNVHLEQFHFHSFNVTVYHQVEHLCMYFIPLYHITQLIKIS